MRALAPTPAGSVLNADYPWPGASLSIAVREERADIEVLLGRPPGHGESFGLDLGALKHPSSTPASPPRSKRQSPRSPARSKTEKPPTPPGRRGGIAFLPTTGRRAETFPPNGWELRATGRLKRLGDPDEAALRLEQLTRLRRALPAGGEPLAQLAARLFGDSHALDPGQPLANLALRLIHHLHPPGEDHKASRTDRRRDTWAAAGVLCDALSAPPVVLNLRSTANHFLGEILRHAAKIGEPIHLTLRQLLRYPLSPDDSLRGVPVFVCENPTITALAADALGPASHPLVCINGEPATPARTLLRQLREAGADIRYHGDFDWRGVQIAGRVFRCCGARPWRFDATAYRAAPKQKNLDGSPSETPWDPELSAAMASLGKSVHEEAIARILIEDLKKPG